VKDQRDEVRKAAETLAESFDQKRKLKTAAKKILTHTMLQNLSPNEFEEMALAREAEQMEEEEAD